MEQKTNYLFGMHPVFEAISAGKNIEKVLLKKGLSGEQFSPAYLNTPFFLPSDFPERSDGCFLPAVSLTTPEIFIQTAF